MLNISDTRRIAEVIAVMLTGTGKFIFVDLLPHKFWFIVAAIVAWTIYILLRANKIPGFLGYWGFGWKNFKKLFLLLLPFVLLIIAGFLVYGFYYETLVIHWHILPTLLLYPVWGTIQQFLMVGLVASNLRDIDRIKIPSWLVILITSFLFSVVHFPSLPLVIATFVLGMIYTILFLRYQNVLVLGIYHGWLGAFFYFFVLGRDTWMEVMNTF